MTKNRWDDHYARKAKKEKRLARSVYKLEEINEKFKLIRRGYKLLDLGCYPGSWSQYLIDEAGPEGKVAGIDLKNPEGLSSPRFTFTQADVLTLDIEWLSKKIGPRNMVVSDLAPNTTGIRLTDTVRSLSLAKRAKEIAIAILKKKGHFVCKFFEGEDSVPFKSEIAKHFQQTRTIRPKATRKRSREIYIVGMGLL